jgi:hypothetical protein
MTAADVVRKCGRFLAMLTIVSMGTSCSRQDNGGVVLTSAQKPKRDCDGFANAVRALPKVPDVVRRAKLQDFLQYRGRLWCIDASVFGRMTADDEMGASLGFVAAVGNDRFANKPQKRVRCHRSISGALHLSRLANYEVPQCLSLTKKGSSLPAASRNCEADSSRRFIDAARHGTGPQAVGSD